VDVMDRGPGVPRAHCRRIFDKFHRIDDSLTAGQPGSGLGLSIAKAVATAYSGEIEVESAPGAGSRFTITLPLAPPDEAAGGELTDE